MKSQEFLSDSLRDAKESLILFPLVLALHFLWQQIIDMLRLASFKSALPALNNVVTNFISFLMLVLDFVHVATRTVRMLFRASFELHCQVSSPTLSSFEVGVHIHHH